MKKLKTHHRVTEAQRKRREKPPLPKVFSAKTLRLCDSVVGVSAFIHNLSDHFLATRAAKHDLAFVGQAADDLEDFLLFVLDFGKTDRAA